MVKIRKFAAYRSLERPYTRRSKYSKKAYIKASPHLSITRFESGDASKKFELTLELKSKDGVQIRHNALEAGRQSSNKVLESNLGKSGFHMKIMVYPHHILRENPLASGAGADRMSTGMQLSFGKPIGAAAQVHPGKTLVRICVNKPNVEFARAALKRFMYKVPCSCSIVQRENKIVA